MTESHGTWTITVEGGPALWHNTLAVLEHGAAGMIPGSPSHQVLERMLHADAHFESGGQSVANSATAPPAEPHETAREQGTPTHSHMGGPGSNPGSGTQDVPANGRVWRADGGQAVANAAVHAPDCPRLEHGGPCSGPLRFELPETPTEREERHVEAIEAVLLRHLGRRFTNAVVVRRMAEECLAAAEVGI